MPDAFSQRVEDALRKCRKTVRRAAATRSECAVRFDSPTGPVPMSSGGKTLQSSPAIVEEDEFSRRVQSHLRAARRDSSKSARVLDVRLDEPVLPNCTDRKTEPAPPTPNGGRSPDSDSPSVGATRQGALAPDLQELILVWPTVPMHLRQIILGIMRSGVPR